jgi:thiol-disulfide isomerase/thioredoxin
MSRRLVAGLVVLVAVGVIVFGLSKQGDVSRIDTAHVKVPPAGFRTFAAASIKGTAFDGTAFSLTRLHGKPVFINFWGSWCVPCKREAPALRAFSRTLGGRAAFVGIAVQSPHKEAVAFARKAGWRYPIVSALCCDLSDRYGVVYMPTTIVVDSRGQVVDRLIGPQTAARLAAEMRALGV